MTIRVFGQTHTGRVRTNNEDAYFTFEGDGYAVGVVADGVGGNEGGEIASGLTVDLFKQLATGGRFELPAEADLWLSVLEIATSRAHNAVIEKSRTDVALKGMACTLTAIRADETQVGFVQIGDSRLYRWDGTALEQVTEDQTVARQLVDSGRMSEVDIADHPDRNRLVQALGADPVDGVMTPVTGRINWTSGDILLLCSDGLTDMIEDNAISHVLANNSESIEQIIEHLIQAALAAGGKDNVTVVVAKNEGGD